MWDLKVSPKEIILINKASFSFQMWDLKRLNSFFQFIHPPSFSFQMWDLKIFGKLCEEARNFVLAFKCGI